MFSKLTFALAMATTAEAVESFYPSIPAETKADWEKKATARNGGTALSNTSGC
jgi:hypothetical protein